jgi:ribosomal protein S27AE
LVDDEEEEVVVRKKSPVMNCERCGRNTHLAEKCYAKTSYAGAPLPPKITVDTPSKIKTIPTIAVLPPKTNAMVDNSTCTRCGRNTHLAEKCYAKTTYAGAPLATDCGRCGRKYHSVCKAVTHVDGTTLDDMDQLTKATQSLHL